jgi:hypothetical protein
VIRFDDMVISNLFESPRIDFVMKDENDIRFSLRENVIGLLQANSCGMAYDATIESNGDMPPRRATRDRLKTGKGFQAESCAIDQDIDSLTIDLHLAINGRVAPHALRRMLEIGREGDHGRLPGCMKHR